MEKAPDALTARIAHRVPTKRGPGTQLYSNRDYERRLTQSGRRIINVDLDASVVEAIDQLRGKSRRGLIIEELLADAIGRRTTPEAAMP